MTKPSWIDAMQEEIHKFERLQVCKLVLCPDKVFLIKLKWIYKMKTNEFGGVLKNKARLVAQGFRPDLTYAVCLCARYQAKPTEKHLNAVKQIFRYLKGTINMGLQYSKDTAAAKVPKSGKKKLPTQGLETLSEITLSEAEQIKIATKRSVGNKMLKAFPLPVISSHCQKTFPLLVKKGSPAEFWFTARIETTDERTKILATVDGKPRTISESSIWRNLKLNDEAGISSLLDAELFENLTLMGRYTRRARIAQSSALPTAADEPASPFGDESQGEACPTISGLETEQDMQTEMATKIASQDLEIASLKARIKMLEDKDAEGVEPSGDDATIKRRSLETGKEAAVEKSTERGSNDTEELVNVLTSLDTTSILTSGVQMVSVPPAAKVATVSVSTGSGLVPTASPIFTTASVVTPYSRLKGKEKMVESDTPKKKKLQEQIDVQMARQLEEEMARDA
nr:retrovirus-related Pol polyprotein from transposon TNT 1-94 [Tanacetum cinerariifolium]GEX33484.1 retrovirus-related Pol polyprotein from transposon TNT 1-94 [Tanacetum cinerariifolium]